MTPAPNTAILPRGRLLTYSIAAYLVAQDGLEALPITVWDQQDPWSEVQSKLDKATGAAMVLWETGFAPADERAPNDVTIRLTLDLIAKPTLALTPITDLAVLVDMALRALAPERSSGYNRDIAESLTAERTSVEGFPTYRFSFSLRTKANAPYIYDAALGPQDLTT